MARRIASRRAGSVPPRGSWERKAALLLAGALILRLWGVSEVRGFTGDEPMHVAAARAITRGALTPSTWWNPPLAYETLAASIAAFGDDAWGWRIRNVVLGALSPLLLALLMLRLFPSRPRAAWLAGWLLAVEPIHVLISRGTFEEVQGACCFLAAVLLAVLGTEGRRTFLWAGLALGGALASKQYYPVAALVLIAWVLARRVDGAPAARPAAVVLRLVAVPAAVYVASYLPWFAAGHGLAELVRLHLDALRDELAITSDIYVNRSLIATAAPSRWFLWPPTLSVVIERGESWSRFLSVGLNTAAAVLVLPAMIWTARVAALRRSPAHVLVVALFAATFLPLLAVPRPIFAYSAVAVLPIAFMAVALALDAAAEHSPRVAAVVAAAVLAYGAYTWPLASSRRVPNALYLTSFDRGVP
jgi:dolichyl-phosphate-mannose--protein O-mannosyl transferase